MSATRTTISAISRAGSTRTAVGETPSSATDAAESRRRERWLVDVAEGRVLAGHDEVHLVAVEAVGARDRQQPDDHETRDQDHRPGDGCCRNFRFEIQVRRHT